MNIDRITSVKINATNLIVRGTRDPRSSWFNQDPVPVSTIVELNWEDYGDHVQPHVSPYPNQITDGHDESVVVMEAINLLNLMMNNKSLGQTFFPGPEPKRLWVIGEETVKLPEMDNYTIVAHEPMIFSEVGARIPYTMKFCVKKAIDNGAEAVVFNTNNIPSMVLSWLSSTPSLLPIGSIISTKKDPPSLIARSVIALDDKDAYEGNAKDLRNILQTLDMADLYTYLLVHGNSVDISFMKAAKTTFSHIEWF